MRSLLPLLLMTLSSLAAHGQGAGDLTVSPTRIAFEGRTRTAEVTLVNSGREPATYRISFTQMLMDDQGRIAEAPRKDGEITAEDLVRYSPRQVELAPGAYQTVRIQLRKPEDLKVGEYRSHMVFRAVPPPEKVDKAKESDQEGFTISLRAIYGVAIPIVVRHGETAFAVKLADLKLEPPAKAGDPPMLALRVLRDGNRSVAGNLEASWTPKGGKPAKAGESPTLAVYSPLPGIRFAFPLQAMAGKTLAGGILKVAFTPTDAKAPVAEAALDLP